MAPLFSHTQQGHSWPRLGLVYPFSCFLLQVAVLKLSQSVSQEIYHIAQVTSHSYTAQKARLCRDVSNGSYSCITQHVQFMKTDTSSSAEGNNKLQTMQAEEMAVTVGSPFPGYKTNACLPLPSLYTCIYRQNTTFGCAGYKHLREHIQASISAGCPSLPLQITICSLEQFSL